MSKIRFRQKQLLLSASIGGAIILFVCVIAGYFIIDYIQGRYVERTLQIEQQLQDAQKKLNEDKMKVIVLNDDHKAGDLITEDDVSSLVVPVSTVPQNTVEQAEIVGKRIKIDVQKNSIITTPMLFEDGITPNDLRNQEFSLVQLPLKLKKDEFVDVRIRFATGQDYIVLSKKKVEDLNNGTIWYKMTEKEILTMSSAIVDAYINDASIYALSYVDPYMQDGAIINYPSNPKVLDLIESNPNIVGLATTALERQVRAKLEQDLQSMSDEDRQKYISGRNTTEMNSREYITETEGQGNGTTSQQDNSLMNENSTDMNQQSNTGNTPNATSDSGSIFKDSNTREPAQ
ncbi:SAF domain-containing protein [Paenibacillus amylolyticus]|uniref:SAF domain-containing protein n=1 Tax=Paenibacillus amylolyticus TaxID=1451 RepID=UPI0039B09DCA